MSCQAAQHSLIRTAIRTKPTIIAVVEEEYCVAMQGRRLGLTVGLESVNWEVRCGVVIPALAEEKRDSALSVREANCRLYCRATHRAQRVDTHCH